MTTLFCNDTIVATLGSGSRGNTTYVGDGRRGVLIDCGLSTKQIRLRLDQIGLGGSRIDAVLITHEHTDHVGSARVLDKHLAKSQGQPVPFYLTRGTARGLNPKVRPSHLHDVQPGVHFSVGAFTIEPLTIPHDTLDPVAYVLTHHGVRVGVITDLGRATQLVTAQIASLDVALVEFNHDEQMLLEGDYPWPLKQRVRGPHGHLSNTQAGALVRAAASPRLKHLILGHLSEDNNRPELALDAATEALGLAGCRGVSVHIAQQRTPLAPVLVPSSPPPRPQRRSRPGPCPAQPDDSSRQVSLFPAL